MKLVASLALAAVAVTLTLPAHAQFAKPEDAIKYRKSALTVMAAHFGRVGAMANGRVPFDAAAIASNAAIAESMSKLPWAAFVDGSGAGDTKAKAEIWSDPAGFKAKVDNAIAMTDRVVAASSGTNAQAAQLAIGEVNALCADCHTVYRGGG